MTSTVVRRAADLTSSTRVGTLLALCASLAGAVVALAPREARAEDLQRRHNFYYRNLTAFRYNPLGLFNEFRIGYRYRTYQALPTILRESYLGVNGIFTLSPAWTRIGVGVEWQPLAILNFNASYEFAGYFGTFDTVQGYANQNVNFSDRGLDRTTNDSYATYGQFLTLGATLQARAGSLVLRSINRGIYSNLALRDVTTGQPATTRPATTYYEIYFDVLAPNKGWYFASDLDIAMIPEGSGFGIGIRTTYTHVFYDSAVHGAAAPNSEAEQNANTLRTGPIFTYNFYEANHSVFNAPTAYLVVNWWVLHRYRAGQPSRGVPGMTADGPSQNIASEMGDYSTQALPYIALGFSFRGDLGLPAGVNRRPERAPAEPAAPAAQ